jgi:hypothetical protein
MSGFRLPTQDDLTLIVVSIFCYMILALGGMSLIKKNKNSPLSPILGLTIAYFFLVFASLIYEGLSIWWPLIFMIFLSGVAIKLNKVQLKPFLLDQLFVMLLLSPLIYLAAIRVDLNWDEYSNWLPLAQYLFDNGHLPVANSFGRSVTPDYPYSRAMLNAWVDIPRGIFSFNVQSILNILMMSSLLLWGRQLVSHLNSGLRKNVFPYFGMMILTFLTPLAALCLSDTLIIASYADTALSIIMMHLVFYVYFREKKKNRNNILNDFDYTYSILLVAPLAIKPVGFYYSLIFYFAHILVTGSIVELYAKNWKIRFFTLVRFTLYLLPLIILKLSWSRYIEIHGIVDTFSQFSLENINSNVIIALGHSIFEIFLHRPYGFVGFFVACFFLARECFRKGFPHQKLILSLASINFAFVFLLHIAAYLLVFSEYEASRAASLARYIAPAGLMTWAAISLYSLSSICRWRPGRVKLVAFTSVLVVSFLIFSNAEKINRYREVNDTDMYKNKAVEIINTLGTKKRLLLVEFLGSGELSNGVRFFLPKDVYVRYVSQHDLEELTEKKLAMIFSQYEAVFILSADEEQKILISSALEIKNENNQKR